MLTGKGIFFQGLEQMPAGGMLLQVKIDDRMELVFNSICSGLLLRDVSLGMRFRAKCNGEQKRL